VEEYTREFEKFVMSCDIRESEDQMLERYLAGLNESIKNIVELRHYTTLDEVCSLATKLNCKTKLSSKENWLKDYPCPLRP